MKILKIYFIVATLMLIAAIGTGVYVWYMYQTVTQTIERDARDALVTENISTDTVITPTSQEPSVSREGTVVNTDTSSPPVTIDATQLTGAQREILKSFGYTGDSITVSEAAISCAEESLGSERFAQILNGGAPTPLEALRIVPCMKQ